MAINQNKNRNVAGDVLSAQSAFGVDGDTTLEATRIQSVAENSASAGVLASRLEMWIKSAAGTLTRVFSVNSTFTPVTYYGAPAAKTTSTTLTAAECLGGMITANQGAAGAATYTLPSGTLLSAAFASVPTVGDSFELTVTNISAVAAEDVTIQGGTGTTLIGNGVVASNNAATDMSAARFRFRNTGANTWDVFRVG